MNRQTEAGGKPLADAASFSIARLPIGVKCIVALLVVFLTGFLTFMAVRNVASAGVSVSDNAQILAGIAEIEADVAKVDQSMSWYCRAGTEDYKAACERSLQNLTQDLAALEKMAGEGRLPALRHLTEIASAYEARAARVLRVRREQGGEAAWLVVFGDEQARTTKDLEDTLGEIRKTENQRLKTVATDALHANFESFALVAVSLVASVLLAGGLIASFKRSFSRRENKVREIEMQRVYLTALANILSDFVYVKDSDGRYLFANKPLRKVLTGDENGRVEGKRVYDFLSPNSADRQDNDDQMVIRHKQAFIERLEKRIDLEGDERWFLMNKLPLFDEFGLIALIGVEREVTATRQMEESLKREKVSSSSAGAVKEDFVTNISHEIRTPMNGILGMADLVMDTNLTPQQRNFMKLIKGSAKDLLDLINVILDFSKGGGTTFELENTPFDLQAVVSEVLGPLAVRAEEKRLRFECRFAGNVPRWLKGDAVRLRQVLMNLVGNAIKFTEGGEVTVGVELESTAQNQAVIRFTIQDTGIGIEAGNFEKIFEAFEQADTSRARRFGGTGLGLTVASQLVKMMGGRIWLESRPGSGSTFFCTASFSLSEEVLPSAKELFSVSGRKVLVVDQDIVSRRGMEKLLSGWQLDIHATGGIAEALEEVWGAIQSGSPYYAVIITSNPSGLDGFELARIIRSEPELKDLELILISPSAEEVNSERVTACGFYAAFLKPVHPQELLESLARLASGAAKSATSPVVASPIGVEAGVPTGAAVAPVAAPSPVETPAMAVANLQSLAGTLSVLVAEDNLVNQAVVVAVLEKRGYRVSVANDGNEAVSLYEAKLPDVIIMDVQMPHMDGISATKAIRRLEANTGRRVPIIALTAHNLKGDRDRCLAAGMDDYMTKPFQKEELCKRIDSFGHSGSRGVPTRGAGEPLPVEVAAPSQPAQSSVQETPLKTVVYGMDDLMANFDDEDLVKTLLAIFLEQTPKSMVELENALAAGKFDEIERTAHSLKGTLGNFGAKTAWQLAQTIEFAGRTQDLDAARESAVMLSKELVEVMGILSRL